jgi:hypothetical protein
MAVTSFIVIILSKLSEPSAEELKRENEIIGAQANREAMEHEQEAYKKHEELTSYAKDLSIVKESWRKGGFGTSAIHSFSLKNASPDYYYKDVTVRFHYIGPSGTEISQHDETVYKAVPAKMTVNVKDLNAGLINGQVSSVQSEIVGATRF